MSGNWSVSASSGTLAPTPKPVPPQLISPQQMAAASGPPYTSTMAVVGGLPVPPIDDPISAVLIFLFLISAAAHMAVLQINKKRGLKFIFSGMLFALCLLRSIALTVRIIWASYPTNSDIAIAANILTLVGSVLVFIINLFFAQRILRAYHPIIGWHQATRWVFRFLLACVIGSLIILIAVSIQSLFTLDASIHRSDREAQLFAGTYLAVLAFLPVPIVILSVLLPRKYHIDKFGVGRWRSKVGLLLFASLVAALGAGFRVGANFNLRPQNDPAWYHSRACYYCFNYVTDMVVSAAYILARFDRRFIIPDGAKGPGDYATGRLRAPQEKTTTSGKSSSGNETGGNDKAKGKGKGKGGVGSLEKFRARNAGLSERTIVNAESDVFGPDDITGWEHHRHNHPWTGTYGGDTTDVDADTPAGAECPGILLNMIDKISDDGGSRDGSVNLPGRARLPRGRIGVRDANGRWLGVGSMPDSPLGYGPVVSAVTLAESINWTAFGGNASSDSLSGSESGSSGPGIGNGNARRPVRTRSV